MLGDGLVSQPNGRIERLRHGFLRQKQVQIALGAVPWIAHEARKVSEAFQHQKLEARRFKCGSDFPIRRFGAFPARRVAGQIAVDAQADPFRQMLAANQAQTKSQLGTVAELKDFLPILFAELPERPEFRRHKAQPGQDRARVRRNQCVEEAQKSNLKANCMRRGSPADTALPKNEPKSA